MTNQEFQLLVVRYFDDALDDTELEQLSQALVMDDARIVHFNDMRLLMVQMRECADPQNETAEQPQPRRFIIHWGWAAAAVAVLATIFGIYRANDVKTTTPPVAILEETEDAVFATPLAIGDAVQTEPLHLISGTANFRLARGALVKLIGPAEFQLQSPLLVTLQHGQLFAKVPRASQGFTVQAGEAQIVDLGTIFAVKLDRVTSDVEARVIKGSIEFQYQDKPRRRLISGEGVQVRNGVMTEPPSSNSWIGTDIEFANQVGRVSIANHSFEQGPLTDGPYHGPLFRDLPDFWTHGAYRNGTWQPARSDYAGVANSPLTDRGVPDFGYHAVPDGTRAAWITAGSYRQTLKTPLQKLRTYRLTVAAGSHLGTGPGSNHPKYGDWGNEYDIQLRAGGIVLASQSGQLPAGTPYQDVSVEFFCPLEHPATNQPLEISLGGTHRIFFDNVRMTIE